MLRKNKEHAELVNRIKSEFLSSMSHEFRTPLNTIIGFSEIMKNELYGPMPNPQYGQYAQDIHETSRYLQELLEDILLLSKAESDIHELQEKPLDVKLLTLRCIRAVSDKLGQLGITVDVQASDSLPKLLMDETRLKLIITNLLSNTAKLATAHGAVTVRIFTEKSKSNQNVFVIAFSDGQESGKIGSNAIEQRNKSSKRPRIEIEGLSIPLSKALVAMHQATLTMSPGSMGKPTVLSVQFGSERIVY